MIIELIRNGFTADALIQLGVLIIVMLISLTFHEYAHGYAAKLCGDDTASNLGRLTLNPLAHLNPVGTLMMLVFGFGYATPVPINTRHFKHFKRDLVFVSLAGPLANFLLAFLFEGLFLLSAYFLPETALSTTAFEVWQYFRVYFVLLNTGLMVFNLIPLPPLDGSRIVAVLLPKKIAFYYLKYEQYIMIAVFVLLYIGRLDGVITFLRSCVIEFIDFIYRLTPLL